MSNVLVVGGGASGMLAALGAAESGAKVTLLERNEKLGKKVYITGKGRCNVTNACEPDAFRAHVVKNPRFLYSALNAFAPADMMALLERLGCPVVVERGQRVFPQSEKASDVTRALERELLRRGVALRLNARVRELSLDGTQMRGVTLDSGETVAGDAVILCTGGCSYPSTGSTGDGFAWLKAAGHTVYPPLPSLIPLISDAVWVKALQGLSLKNVRLTVKSGKKTLYTEIGEMLFTHFGVSGPLVLSASAYLAELDPREARLILDLKPGLTPEQVDARLLREIDASGKKQLKTLLCALYPTRLAESMPERCGVSPLTLANELTKEQRARLVENAKALEIPISGTCPLAEAVVTRGGVSVRELEPSTMESKRIRGLYVAGELLDVDALTGGFNLQIAFSTGLAAGRAAGRC